MKEIQRTVPIETGEDEYIVEGYAVTFDPYVLYRDESGNVFEAVDRNAFATADMGDVIFQYDHEGAVLARSTNGTLTLSVDDHGLKVRADLSKSRRAKELYEDIKAGLVTKMSFRAMAESEYDFQHVPQILVTKVGKLYDVSAVSIPANDGTEIVARDFKAAKQEMENKKEKKRKRLALEIALEGEI